MPKSTSHQPAGSGATAALLASIGDAVPSQLTLLDGDGVIRAVNCRWSDLGSRCWLVLPEPAVGASYLDLCDAVAHGETVMSLEDARVRQASAARSLAAAIRDVLAGGARRRRFEYECGESGNERRYEVTVAAIDLASESSSSPGDGEPERLVLVAHHDTTAHQAAQRRLEESLRQVRDLASHLQDAREQERRLIAREVHDDLGHQLTAAKIDLVSLERELQRGNSSLAGRVASMKTLLDQVISSVRRISSELRPGLLDDFGLAAAIEWQAEEFEEATGVAAEVAVRGGADGLAAPLETAVYRILQEALENVARHARASRVRIALVRNQRDLRLEVSDDGIGFEACESSPPESHGITGMRERAIALAGAFAIGSLPGRGTTITVRLPLHDSAAGLAPALAAPPVSAAAS